MDLYVIAGSLKFEQVINSGHGVWFYAYFDGHGEAVYSDDFDLSIKPSVEHFTAWITSSISTEPAKSQSRMRR